MNRSHPADCKCNCHADPGNKRMEAVFLQKDDADLRRCFSHAVFEGFTNPCGFRCRDCNQYYGVDPVTNQLRPITGDQIYGPHPDIAHGPFDPAVHLGWRALNWLTPAFAPVWLQVKIWHNLRAKEWEIVTRWTMV